MVDHPGDVDREGIQPLDRVRRRLGGFRSLLLARGAVEQVREPADLGRRLGLRRGLAARKI
ncbi:MAG: hypothetical protein DCF30_09015, partial [Hyphomicrobiales bacterium]